MAIAMMLVSICTGMIAAIVTLMSGAGVLMAIGVYALTGFLSMLGGIALLLMASALKRHLAKSEAQELSRVLVTR